MKLPTFVFALIAMLFVSLYHIPYASAVGSGAQPVRNIYGANPVQPFAYTTLIASTVKGISGLQVNNTGPRAIELAFGALGSESAQIIVGSFQDTGFLPVAGGYATRLSVIALDGPAETGELDVNVMYN